MEEELAKSPPPLAASTEAWLPGLACCSVFFVSSVV